MMKKQLTMKRVLDLQEERWVPYSGCAEGEMELLSVVSQPLLNGSTAEGWTAKDGLLCAFADEGGAEIMRCLSARKVLGRIGIGRSIMPFRAFD